MNHQPKKLFHEENSAAVYPLTVADLRCLVSQGDHDRTGPGDCHAFWQSTPTTRGGVAPSWQLVRHSESSATRSSGTAPAYYVFANANGPGFVIVAGDDVAHAVLGYSFENEFPSGNLPANLQEWLDGIREEVNYARKNRLQAESSVSQAWAATRAGTPVVEMETALWDQGAPFNKYCPTTSGR